jgi:hypothetical protein
MPAADAPISDRKTPPPRETLLVAGVRIGIHGWQKYASPFGLPIFWGRSHGQAHRALNRIDMALLVFLAGSIVTFTCWPGLHGRIPRALAAGMALYRVLDIAITLGSIGIFGALREGIEVEDLPRHHVQRMLIASLLSYIELMFWFALMHQWIASMHPDQYATALNGRKPAFFVSMETLTTVGYGLFAPTGTYAMIVAGAEAILGLIIYAVVVGALVGSIKEAAREETHMGRMGYRRFVLHTLGPILGYLACCMAGVLLIGV